MKLTLRNLLVAFALIALPATTGLLPAHAAPARSRGATTSIVSCNPLHQRCRPSL
jgi:hypothetical protein